MIDLYQNLADTVNQTLIIFFHFIYFIFNNFAITVKTPNGRTDRPKILCSLATNIFIYTYLT